MTNYQIFGLCLSGALFLESFFIMIFRWDDDGKSSFEKISGIICLYIISLLGYGVGLTCLADTFSGINLACVIAFTLIVGYMIYKIIDTYNPNFFKAPFDFREIGVK